MNTQVKTFAPVNSFLDTFFNDTINHYNYPVNTIPAVNIQETDNEILLDVALPGVEKEDVKINLDQNLLTISSQKEKTEEEVKKNFHKREFSYESFKRSFRIPKSVDTDAIVANYVNGVLKLTLPKKEEAKPKEPRFIDIA